MSTRKMLLEFINERFLMEAFSLSEGYRRNEGEVRWIEKKEGTRRRRI
jgi:hypothetical protein